MKNPKSYRGMVLFTVLALLSIYFIVVFQFIGFYRNQQYQLSQLVHFYEMKTLVNLSYRRVSTQKEVSAYQLKFNKGSVLFQPQKDEWCFEVTLNTGEKRRFYREVPKQRDAEEVKETDATKETKEIEELKGKEEADQGLNSTLETKVMQDERLSETCNVGD